MNKYFYERKTAFLAAANGVRELIRHEAHARIHCLATLLVMIAAVLFKVSAAEACALILTIALVWTAEALNTALESLADAVSAEYSPRIKRVKDFAAAAVLLSAIGAAGVGVIIFLPKIFRF